MTLEPSLAGRTAVVTGGGVGIGQGVVTELARRGARVALTYLTHPPADEVLADVERESGHPLVAVQLDLTDEAATAAALPELASSLGGLDILVNNAGGLIDRVPFAEMDYAFWRRVIEVNVHTTFLATRHLLPYLRDSSGRVITIASVAGRNGGGQGATAYATAKSAIFGLTRALAKELAPRGVTVNALAPGLILDTPFHDTFTPVEAQRQAIAAIPLGRPGYPADVASAVAWLAGDGASFVTGTIIDVNGGQYFG